MDNFTLFEEKIMEIMPIFGDCGIEISDNHTVEMDQIFERPLRAFVDPDDIDETTGQPLVRRREWNIHDDKLRETEIERNKMLLLNCKADSLALWVFLTGHVSTGVKNKMTSHVQWAQIEERKDTLEFYRLIQKITTSEIHRTKDGIMSLLKLLK
jgi:hypothetical protein